MGVLLKLSVTNRGSCMVKPGEVELVTEIPVALRLLAHLTDRDTSLCLCRFAVLLDRELISWITILDEECRPSDYPVQTFLLEKMKRQELLYETGDGITCTRLQGIILKMTPKGNARAALIGV